VYLIHCKEVNQANKNSKIQKAMCPNNGWSFFLECHEDAQEYIYNMKPDRWDKPDQR